MASLALEDGGDDAMVVLSCIDRQKQGDCDGNQYEDEVMISTVDAYRWNFPSILQNRIIKIKAQKNRLIEHSSYFRGLLGGNFGDPDLEILVEWNQPTFLSLLASLFGSPMDITSDNFLSLFEGALYFGMERNLSECKIWLTKAISVNEVALIQLNDLVSIWEFGSELVNNYLPDLCTTYLAKNFIWAMSCSCFCDVPYDLLLSSIKHPHLTVDSEKQFCDALFIWISANKQQYTEDVCINIVKQIRLSLLPLWFVTGKNTNQLLSMCPNESFSEAITLWKQPYTCRMDGLGEHDLLNLRIRLTEFTQRVDVSGCAQINPSILLLSILPISVDLKPQLRKEIGKLLINQERINAFPWDTWPNLTLFKAIHEIDISNCPMLPLDSAIDIFSKSFPSLTKLNAANHLTFRTIKLWKIVKRCPLLSDIDLSVDLTPIIPSRVSILSSFPRTRTSSMPWFNTSPPLSFNLTKLTLEGRIDITDFDLGSISNICGSLTYVSLRGCTSVSDVGISALISKCLKLNSVLACDTFFGQQSVLALCSSNAYDDDDHHHLSSKHVNITQRCNLQMLHIGGCKGVDLTCFAKLLSCAYMLKSLCLRETEVVDDVLFSFLGTSLEALDVSNTKVCGGSLAHIIGRNPGLKCLKTRGCNKLVQQETNNIFSQVARCCKLDEISVGWGFSYLSLQALNPAVSLLKSIQVGVGGTLGHHGLKLLPAICPLLESLVLYFQVISDDVIVNILETLKHLRSFHLCHCLGEISSLSLQVSVMPNLRKLRLERVAPWMSNLDLVNLTRNCANLVELSLLGCPLLNSESQSLISSGWPGLISIHLEECGQVTRNGVVSLFDCHALEDVLLRHNGSGIQKCFIAEAVTKLPLLRKISLDVCDAKDGDFDIPEVEDGHFLSHVKIARCKGKRCSFKPQHVWASMVAVHQETLVLVWDSKHLTTVVVKERV